MKFFLIPVLQRQNCTFMITMIQIFLNTLNGNHHWCISIHIHFTSMIIPISKFFLIQFKRHGIPGNSLFFPETAALIIHSIHIRIKNRHMIQSHRFQNSKALQISYKES